MHRVIVILSLTWLFSAGAQSPLLEAMRYVPAEAFLAEPVNMATFADIRAGYAVRGVQPPDAWADMQPESERDILSSLPAGTAHSVTTFLRIGGPLYPELLGLDFFDLNATLEFGEPPNQALVLLGNIEPDRVTQAFLARDYRLTEPLLCPAAGCETGREANLINREPGNPFGGDLGRNFPVFTRPGAVAGSASDVLALQMAASAAGELDSLADLPEVQALDAVLADMPHVLAVTVLNPLPFLTVDPLQVLGSEPDMDAASAALDQLAQFPLPPYSLIAFAATADQSSEHGHALLVYPDADQADAAAAALDARLHTLTAQRSGLSYAGLLTDRGAELRPATTVTGPEGGPSVVVITVTASLEDSAAAPFTGLSYRDFINLVQSRDHLWLVPGH